MTTRPTDEEIREMADHMQSLCDFPDVAAMLRAWLTERQAARDVAIEIWHKAINAWLPAMRHGTKEQSDKIAIDIIQSIAQPQKVVNTPFGNADHIPPVEGVQFLNINNMEPQQAVPEVDKK